MNTSKVQTKILKHLPDSIDYLLVCASFEERCLSTYDWLKPNRISKTGVFYFTQFLNSTAEHIEKLKTKFNADIYPLDYTAPITSADAMMKFLEEIEHASNKPNIVIDISTFTRESLLIVLKYLLLNEPKFSDIYLFYRFATVSEYLSDGVAAIRSVLGYIGDVSVEKPTHLVLLSGFEYERAKEIIDTLEPDFISIGYGGKDKSITQELHSLNVDFTNKLIAYYSDENVAIFEHSLRDPGEVKEVILSLVKEKPEYNTVIAPLNNKISTVGAALAAAQNDAIQLIYAQMEEYNETGYSRGEDDCLIYNLKTKEIY